jgi:hypothetical protein
MRPPILFAVIVIVAMVLDMCAFPPSRRNVVLAQTCGTTRSRGTKAGERALKLPPPVEKEEACQ